ncbi:F-box protein At3g07870-like isoform X1 [Rhododendron vialii]|uniref:F-box protein At3g07870-like isoform X1 n=1 Tax=Rhododendron vialii TaxID=182163 RepID=UPI00265FE2BB|nr:F-box protein At3g07870-like isoform X1 [Rhododendron vialii]XP_058208999.1 F-box protein At3g07870-like isoform X1 [Rhododendron vialii]
MSDYIPTELLAGILVRLPVEPLIRFTSVCKSWYSLITSPSFVAEHLDHTKTNTENLLLKTYDFVKKEERYLLCRGDEKFSDEFSELEFPLSTQIGHKRIVASYSGLLCMIDGGLSGCIILWNPSIRKSVTLPMPSLPQSSHRRFVLGFGAHPKTRENMVVFILYEMADVARWKFPSKVELYTQGARSWRSIHSVGHPHYLPCDDWFPAFVNGSVHWIARDMRAFDADGIPSLIMLFNMGSQAFSVLMMPGALVSENPLRLSIMSYRESLAVSCHGRTTGGSSCLWVMKEYGVEESWAKLYNITLPGMLVQIRGFRENGEVLAWTGDNQLLCYNCETKTFANSGYTGNSFPLSSYAFMESLVLVQPGNGFF